MFNDALGIETDGEMDGDLFEQKGKDYNGNRCY